MTELLQNKLDHKLFERFCALPLFEFYKLIRPSLEYQEKQRLQFFKTLENPIFSYPLAKAFDVNSYIAKIDECKKDMSAMPAEPWILALYTAKLEELKKRARMVEAVSSGQDEKVCAIAKELFGDSQLSVSSLEHELSDMMGSGVALHAHVRRVDAKMFETMVREVLDYYKMNDWKIKFHNGTCVKLTRARKAKYLIVYIPKKFQASRARAKRILVHEIEVHALRTQNAQKSPLHIFSIGLDNYLETEEGLALFYQQKIKENKKFDPGFWESYACALSQEHSFTDVFKILLSARTRLDQTVGHNKTDLERKEKIWNLCVRTYKGITKPNKPGLGTCKDSIYRSGLQKIRQLNLDDKEIEKQIFSGNIGIQHMDTMKHLNLSYVTTPKLVSDEICKKVYKETKNKLLIA